MHIAYVFALTDLIKYGSCVCGPGSNVKRTATLPCMTCALKLPQYNSRHVFSANRVSNHHQLQFCKDEQIVLWQHGVKV